MARDVYPDAAGLIMEYCIAGHHSGIPDGSYKNDTSDMPTLCGGLKRSFNNFSAYKDQLQFPEMLQKADISGEIYLMNMPTGSGKTLCSVKFALERAARTGKKRIIYVIPYNSIID